MTEPYDPVYVTRHGKPTNAYHLPERRSFQVETRCGRLLLLDCTALPEIEAALTREPCLRCFPLRGRRQRILNQVVVAGVPDA